ncbi:serum amyloid P-component-like [Parambassis ranga]|uniref:Pentraxin family member n=1 Tax=Parambassis ranga TaxID=210632 RepID=A0A6P7JY44_9TELE|nr:serum amyloid P-component-like [Parambassis ranga]
MVLFKTMVCLLLLMMLAACAASPQDLSGKMFTFPEETNTANVKLSPSTHSFNALTVCFRSITDLSRGHSLFSLATPTTDNSFLIYMDGELQLNINDKLTKFPGLISPQNVWNSICSTWDAASGLAQLWVNGKHSVRKFTGGPAINNPVIILGQEQDSLGGSFVIQQSFVGMMSDVHMWDHTLSSCEIQQYMDKQNFSPGNVLNWQVLDFQMTGRVLIEDKQTTCN